MGYTSFDYLAFSFKVLKMATDVNKVKPVFPRLKYRISVQEFNGLRMSPFLENEEPDNYVFRVRECNIN